MFFYLLVYEFIAEIANPVTEWGSEYALKIFTIAYVSWTVALINM